MRRSLSLSPSKFIPKPRKPAGSRKRCQIEADPQTRHKLQELGPCLHLPKVCRIRAFACGLWTIVCGLLQNQKLSTRCQMLPESLNTNKQHLKNHPRSARFPAPKLLDLQLTWSSSLSKPFIAPGASCMHFTSLCCLACWRYHPFAVPHLGCLEG